LTTKAYYNEVDPFAAAWLRELITRNLIAPGEVDTRDIRDVKPSELLGFNQHHFFAGIGGWSYALRLAGWPDDLPVWTGSCPCQPFSAANVWQGGGKGAQDERHLLPAFAALVRARRPAVVFGEQVSGAIKKGWLDELHDGFEDYTVGAVVLPASAVGADHLRKRLYWVADSSSARRQRHQPLKRFPVAEEAPFAKSSDTFLGARRVMDRDYSAVLPCDGLSVVLERSAVKGYGNAIVPQVAAAFITAYMESTN
jgi:DNA (cytosine-5)-methyltransferase 1